MHLKVNTRVNYLAVELLVFVVVPGRGQHLLLTVIHLLSYRRQETIHIDVHAVDTCGPQGYADGVAYLNQVINHPLRLGGAFQRLTIDKKDTVVAQIERVFAFVGQTVQRRALPERASDFIEMIGHPAFPHVITHAAIDTLTDALAGKENDSHRRFSGQLFAQHVVQRGHDLFVRTG